MNYDDVSMVLRVVEELNELGLKMLGSGTLNAGPLIVVVVDPQSDKLPIYTRGATVFRGTVEEIRFWLNGIEWARNYYTMLKVVTPAKIEKSENNIRHKHLMKTLINIDNENEEAG